MVPGVACLKMFNISGEDVRSDFLKVDQNRPRRAMLQWMKLNVGGYRDKDGVHLGEPVHHAAPSASPLPVKRDQKSRIARTHGERSPRAHLELKHRKTAERFISIREQLGPSLGVIQGGQKNLRKPNASTFENRDPNDTSW